MARLGPALAFGALSGIRKFQQVSGQRQAMEQAAGFFEGLGPAGQRLAELARNDPANLMRIAQQFGGFNNLAGFVQQQQAQQLQQQQLEQVNAFREQQLDISRRGAAASELTAQTGVARESRLGQPTAESPIAKVDPDKFVPASVQEFVRTGNFGVLRPIGAVSDVVNIIRNGALTSVPEDQVRAGDIRVSSQNIPIERGDVGLTQSTQTDIQQRLLSLDQLSSAITNLIPRVEAAGEESFGLQGVFGEFFIDGLLGQILPGIVNIDRRDLRQTARIEVQQQLRNISSDQRFTEKEREAVKEIIGSLLSSKTSKPQVTQDLLTLKRIVDAAEARTASLPGRLGARLGAANDLGNISNLSDEELDAGLAALGFGP